MLTKRDIVFQFMKDSFGKALIFVGISSAVIGLLFVSAMGTLVSALGLFLGVLFIDAGFAVQFELFNAELRSKEGLGNILLCISPLLIAGGAISLLFAVPDYSHAYMLPPTRMGWVEGFKGWVVVVAPLVRVYLWMAIPLAVAGVVLFVVGFLFRLYDVFF